MFRELLLFWLVRGTAVITAPSSQRFTEIERHFEKGVGGGGVCLVTAAEKLSLIIHYAATSDSYTVF